VQKQRCIQTTQHENDRKITVKKPIFMKIIIFSATKFEIAPLEAFLSEKCAFSSENTFHFKNNVTVECCITGVGLPIAMHCLAQKLHTNTYTHALQIGIAGAFVHSGLRLGEVVQVVSDRFADIGAEDADGSFLSVNDLGFAQADDFPFKNGTLQSTGFEFFTNIKKVNGISLNTASGSVETILRLTQRYTDAHTESMEGAAFMYAALCAKIPNIAQIRGISNFITPRNRADWQVGLAITKVCKVLIDTLNMMCEKIHIV
jgi:futalosine hydrolase